MSHHESLSRVGGSDSEKTLPSRTGHGLCSNPEQQVSTSNLFNQSKSKIEDVGHQCVGEGLDQRIDQENQILIHQYQQQLDELDKKFGDQELERRSGNNKIHVHLEEFKEQYQELERPHLSEQKSKLSSTQKIRSINVEYRDRLGAQNSPAKQFNSHYHSEHNIDTIIQDEQLVPQYFKSAVYTEEIESKNENDKQSDEMEDSKDDFRMSSGEKGQPRRLPANLARQGQELIPRNENGASHVSSRCSRDSNERKILQEQRSNQINQRVIDYAIENPVAQKAHNSCMDLPDSGNNFQIESRFDEECHGNSLQNLNLNKYRYDDYQTSNCSQYLKNHIMQRQNQIKLNLRDVSNSDNDDSQEMEIGHAVL